MPESPDGARRSRPLREAFGVRGPLLGGPALLLRTWWLVPLAFAVTLPFELLAWSTSCAAAAVCADPNHASELLSPPRTVWPQVWTRVLRGGIELPPQMGISAVTVLAAARICSPAPPKWGQLRRIATRAAPHLAMLGALILMVPAVATTVPALVLQRHWDAVVGGSTGLTELVALSAVSVLLLIGAVCGLAAALLGFVAVPAVLLDRDRAPRAIGRVLRLVLRRLAPTLLTAFVVMALPEITDFVSAAATPGDSAAGSWWPTAVRVAASSAVTFPLSAAMYFVRYLDLRRRSDGYDRAWLAAQLRAPTPR